VIDPETGIEQAWKDLIFNVYPNPVRSGNELMLVLSE
jgi:hypothetical protein